MSIETSVDARLWGAVQSTYGARNFTGAILDALYFMSDVIREKTGLECDGIALAGQALGGKAPKLRVNKLETESEKNIQAGLEQILRGLYQAVRNPRSHGKHNDKQEDADAIILFANYLLHIIDQSKAPFTKSELLTRVFDAHFVEKERYADLLASEVPPKHRLEVILDVVRARETGQGKKLKYFVRAILTKLTKDQRKEFYSAISDELKTTESESAIRTLLHILPDDSLTHCDEASRLRVETMLLQSIAAGRYDDAKDQCPAGALGTWAMNRCTSFLQKDELVTSLVIKLASGSASQNAYVFKYFWNELLELTKGSPQRLVRLTKTKLKAGNKGFYDKVKAEEMFGDSTWVEQFRAELDAFKEPEPTAEPGESDNLQF